MKAQVIINSANRLWGEVAISDQFCLFELTASRSTDDRRARRGVILALVVFHTKHSLIVGFVGYLLAPFGL
jgi:hypothetical protein